MRKEYRFMVTDTETATLPFANEIANGDPEKKKKIAIARPLVYDIGWTITNRKGEILDSKQFLVAETFAVPAVFNTAYYAEKRPRYLEMLKRGETTIKPWDEIMEIYLTDLRSVDAVGAYNSMFDFKKAIPFTELYINMLYSPDFYDWDKMQERICKNIASDNRFSSTKEFDPDIFKFRGKDYKLFDLWGLSCEHILNNDEYKTMCQENGWITESGKYYKTSAETAFRFISRNLDFDEAHTALDDAAIESELLARIMKTKASNLTMGIIYFPFRILGYATM
jgi:hypothetical protein